MEKTLTPAYMPFTYLSESAARLLTALVGPVVVYQPLKTNIPENLGELASQGLVEIRTPITRDDDRLRAALAEFTDWARMNPGKSTPGAAFLSMRQGEVPFFDESVINRIRSDINRYRRSDPRAEDRPNHPPNQQMDQTEAGFSARLFLALAQENDLATDRLDHDLNQFKALEKKFLETLKDADDGGFSRQAFGGAIWREDPGAKLTGQRIRAWASLAAADAELPSLLVTNSSAVMDTLLETRGEAIGLEKLADIRLPVPSAGSAPALSGVLADLEAKETLSSDDRLPFEVLSTATASDFAVTASLFVTANRAPATVIRQMAPATVAPIEEMGKAKSDRHTLILQVKG